MNFQYIKIIKKKTIQEHIIEFACQFVRENFDYINLDILPNSNFPTTKLGILREIEKDKTASDAMWIILQVSSWGMKKDVKKEFLEEEKKDLSKDDNFQVYKLGDRYVKYYSYFSEETIEETFPKERIEIYFE